ncbi:MAG: histidine--tRNA ligase [Tissierellales bacterium]|jgi:histidyl-tRNA synthetase|nr:histidine--tRNA ligase [Tissierellales bacterium]
MKLIAPKGTQDVLPNDAYKWHYLEELIREVCREFGYKELRTPTFEHTELFKRGVGETTDVVQKEMYTFEDKKGRSITLKPEGTAPVVRAYVERKLSAGPQPTKVYYLTPCFRYERPQAGRMREFHQFGVEAFGAQDPTIDAEVISIAHRLFEKLGLENIELNINSIGCPKCRAIYHEKLKEFLKSKLENLCGTCKERFETNPMRIIDCKVESCQAELTDVPLMLDYLCEDCEEHFGQVKMYLESIGIPFVVNPKIVRGLDYYTKTAFEFISKDIGSQGTVCGGGRYDKLVKEIGGPEVPGIGFGMGMERLLLTLDNLDIEIPNEETVDVFVVTLGENARKKGFEIVYKLRKMGYAAELDHLARSAKAQFKYSNKMGSKVNLTLGDQELESGVVMLKDMQKSEQSEVEINNIYEAVEAILGGK